MGFSGGSAGKDSTYNVGNLGSMPGLGRSPGEGNSYQLQYSGLENSMDCIVHEDTNSWIQLSGYMHLKGNSAIFFSIFWQMSIFFGKCIPNT